jgi:hypothetical protein
MTPKQCSINTGHFAALCIGERNKSISAQHDFRRRQLSRLADGAGQLSRSDVIVDVAVNNLIPDDALALGLIELLTAILRKLLEHEAQANIKNRSEDYISTIQKYCSLNRRS